MTIGSAILLIAIGAILKWAVTAHVKGFDIQTTGTVLFIVGLVGLALAMVYTFLLADRRRIDDHTRVRPPGPYE
jgi:Co/Zn/Cd efflux system component